MKHSKIFVVAALAALLLSPSAFAQDDTLFLDLLNAELAASGAGIEIAYAEYVTAPDAPEFGRTVYASNRGNKQLSADFVPGDSRRAWGFGTGITFAVDYAEGGTASGLTANDTTGAIFAAMNTWNTQACSNLPIFLNGVYGFDIGYVQFLLGFGGFPGIAGDVTHAGWVPGAFFDAIAPGGSGYILGVTFTFVFLGGDTNNDGKSDAAFREIYYNNVFSWAIGSTYDVETVALHEAGHGLSQGHFGDIFRDGAGGLHFAPRAVMNAAYSGVQQELTGTDKGGHCSIWGNWPNN